MVTLILWNIVGLSLWGVYFAAKLLVLGILKILRHFE